MKQKPRQLLRLSVRVLVVLGAAGFLIHALQWRDRVRVVLPSGTLEGAALEQKADGTADLRVDDGHAIALSPEQVSGAVRVPGVQTTLASTSPLALLAVLGLFVLGLTAVSLRWWSLLRLLGLEVNATACVRALFQAQTVGLILPGSVGGDLYRVAALAKSDARISVGESGLSILVDRVLGLWVMLVLSGALALAFGAAELGRLAMGLLGTAAVAPMAVVLLLPLARFLPGRWRESRPAMALRRLAVCARQRPGRLIAPVVFSATNAALQTTCVLVLLTAYWQRPPNLGGAVAAIAVVFMVNALPLSPGGIGVGEAAYVLLLGRLGAPAAPVVATSLGFRLVIYAVAIFASLLFLRRGSTLGSQLAAAPSHSPHAHASSVRGEASLVQEVGGERAAQGLSEDTRDS